MKAADLRVQTKDELMDQLQDLKKEALNLRFQHNNSSLFIIMVYHGRLWLSA